MSKQKLEKVLELMINEESDKASELLHDIFVEKARRIYANMIKEDQDIERDLNEADWDDEYDFDTSDAEEDLEKDTNNFDVEGLNDEIDNEEMYEQGEDEDEFDSEVDLGDEMGPEDDMDMDMDMDSEDEMNMDMDSEGSENPAAEALMNVEEALKELKLAFADLVGETNSEEKSEDEYDANDYEYGSEEKSEDEGEEEIKESATLTKISAPKLKGGDDGKASPFAKVKDSNKLGNPMKNAIKNSEETGGKAIKAKPIGVPGPQDVDSKLKPASVRKMKG
jgi:hypothetical protein